MADFGGDSKMKQVTNCLVETQKFYESTMKHRSTDENENLQSQTDKTKDLPPVFNKRLFATQGAVIITKEAKRVMLKNSRREQEGTQRELMKQELLSMRSVVDGLKLIHKNQDYLKDLLSHVVTLETYDPFQYVVKKHWEDSLSCYYIVHGAVEVTYDMKTTESRNVYQPNIIYSHGTGEYVGIVSSEGRDEDIAPPATVYTKELSEFLRIDRERFHTLVEAFTSILKSEIEDFLNNGESILSKLSDATKARILPMIEKQEYSPNRDIIRQGESSDYLYIIRSGRCECYREVYIPEANVSAVFYINSREQYEFFGEESLVADEPSYARITTTCTTVCYKLPRVAFQIVNRESLHKVIEDNRHEFPGEQELMDRGYRNTVWNNYKFYKVKETLQERGKLQYMWTTQHCPLIERPPSAEDQRRENMYRFTLKGSHMEPLRARSAMNFVGQGRRPISRRRRPATARPRNSIVTENEEDSEDIEDDESDTSGEPEDVRGSTLLSMDLAKTLEKHYTQDSHIAPRIRKIVQEKDIDKENLLQILEEENDLSRHLKKAWDSHEPEEEEEKEGFMKNSVLVTMKSDDIVRKAMAMADKQAVQTKKRDKNQEEEWNTILHAENKQAKVLVTANEARIKILRRKLDLINKKKKKLALQRHKGTHQEEGGAEKETIPKRFALDEIRDKNTKSKEEIQLASGIDVKATLLTKKDQMKVRQRSLEDCTRRIDNGKAKDEDRCEVFKGSIYYRPSSAIVTRQDAKLHKEIRRKSQGSKSDLSSDNASMKNGKLLSSSGESLVLSSRRD